jgi:hypothetical protein
MALPGALKVANRASWKDMLSFVNDFPDDKWKDWKAAARPVLEAAIQSGVCEYFSLRRRGCPQITPG